MKVPELIIPEVPSKLGRNASQGKEVSVLMDSLIRCKLKYLCKRSINFPMPNLHTTPDMRTPAILYLYTASLAIFD